MFSVEALRARREAGFTLVEILMAMVVFGVVLTLVVQLYDRTMSLFRQGGQQYQQTRAVLSLIETLRGDINAAEGVELPSVGTPAGNPETGPRTRTKAPWRGDVGLDGVRYEIEYPLEPETSKKMDPNAPASMSRKRLVREVRRSGETTAVASRVFDLELSQFQIKERVAARTAPSAGGAASATPAAGGAVPPTPAAGGAVIPGASGAAPETPGAGVAAPSGAGEASTSAPGTIATSPLAPVALEIRLEYFITKTGPGSESCTLLVERLVQESTGVDR